MGKLTQEAKDKIAAKAKERWANPAERLAASKRTAKQWEQADVRALMSANISTAQLVRMTPEVCASISKQRKGKTMDEIHGAQAAREIYFKRYGFYPEERVIDAQSERRTQRNRLFSRAVFERDDYTCKDCGARGGKLHAHHIEKWIDRPDLRFELSNGVTLCPPCHRLRHKEDKSRWAISRTRRSNGQLLPKCRVRYRVDALDHRSAPLVPLGGDSAKGY